MISDIIRFLIAEIRSQITNKYNQQHVIAHNQTQIVPNLPEIVAANAPAYTHHSNRTAANSVILSAGGFSFTGTGLHLNVPTGFKRAVPGFNAEPKSHPQELKLIFTADFDDAHYLDGLSQLESIAALLHESSAMRFTDSQNQNWDLIVVSEAGMKGELASMLRAFSGKLLPAISYTVRISAIQ